MDKKSRVGAGVNTNSENAPSFSSFPPTQNDIGTNWNCGSPHSLHPAAPLASSNKELFPGRLGPCLMERFMSA